MPSQFGKGRQIVEDAGWQGGNFIVPEAPGSPGRQRDGRRQESDIGEALNTRRPAYELAATEVRTHTHGVAGIAFIVIHTRV